MKNLIFTILILVVSSMVHAATSSENRQKLKYEAGWRFGSDFALATGNEISVGKYLESDELLSLRIGTGEDEDDDNSRDKKRKQFVTALQLKHFEDNSFYISPGLYYLNYFEDEKNNSKPSGHHSVLGVDLRIGNQWQWSHWTIGADWIGIGRNVMYWSNSSNIGNNVWTFLNVQVAYAWW